MEVENESSKTEFMEVENENEWRNKVNVQVKGFTFNESEFKHQLSSMKIFPSSMFFTNHPQGKCFLDFETEQEALQALQQINLNPFISFCEVVKHNKSKKEIPLSNGIRLVLFGDFPSSSSLTNPSSRFVLMCRSSSSKDIGSYWHVIQPKSQVKLESICKTLTQELNLILIANHEYSFQNYVQNLLIKGEFWKIELNPVNASTSLSSLEYKFKTFSQNHLISKNIFQWMKLDEAISKVHQSEKLLLEKLQQEYS